MIARTDLISELEEAISQRSPERRAEALRHVTDLFVLGAAEYTEEQVALFDDVIERLAAEIEISARALLAKRLAPIPNAPPRVIRILAFDDAIEVARPILSLSERLDDPTLVQNAQTKSQQHLLAISVRKSLGEAVTDVLIERGDQQVVMSTVRNRGARFSDLGFTVLVKRAEGNDELAASVGARPEIPRHQFLKLLAAASRSVREKLEAANPQAIDEIKKVVSEVTNRIQAEAITTSPDYAEARALVGKMQAAGSLGEREVEDLAAAGNFEATVVAISALCELPLDMVERTMVQERSEMLLIILKSIGLSWPTAKQILLLRARDRAMSTHEIEQALASFERLKPVTAQQVVRFHQARMHAGGG